MNKPLIKVNSRVFIDNISGHLRYISDVNDKGSYIIGIELDRPLPGCTDGSYNGVKYFECEDGRGLFREIDDLSKLHLSFLQAVEYRYLKGYLAKEDISDIIHIEDRQDDSVKLIIGQIDGKDIEFFSNDRQEYHSVSHEELKPSRYCRVISVESHNVSKIDEDEVLDHRLESFLDAIEIDLTNNLIENWRDAEVLLKRFTQVESLILSQNPISINIESISTNIYNQLKKLSLNFTNVKWEDVLYIERQLPNLQELELTYNQVKEIPDTFKGNPIDFNHVFKNLIYVNLEGNEIDDWNKLKGLLHLMSLERLNLNSNKISDICDGSYVLKSLKSLSISDCPIAEWKEIEKLNTFNSLEELSIKRIGLLSKCNFHDNILRRTSIAILYNIKMINGSIITKKEREDSERFYFTQFIKNNKNHDYESLRKIDKTFNRLAEQRGEDGLEIYNKIHSIFNPDTSKTSNFLTVLLRSKDNSKSFQKKLPKSTPVSKLKFLASKLFKCDIDELEMYIDEPVEDIDLLVKIESNIDMISDYANSDTLSIMCTW